MRIDRYVLEGKVAEVIRASTLFGLGKPDDYWIIVVMVGEGDGRRCAEVVKRWGTTADRLELIIDWSNKDRQDRDSSLVTLKMEYQRSPGISVKADLYWEDWGIRQFMELTRASARFAVGFGYYYQDRQDRLQVAIARHFVQGSPSAISEIPASGGESSTLSA